LVDTVEGDGPLQSFEPIHVVVEGWRSDSELVGDAGEG
jgi:hypothetical protein